MAATYASTAARELAAELGVEVVSGTGRDGAVTVADVRAAADSEPAEGSHPAPPPGLGDAGRELWQLVYGGMPEGWVFDDRETAILTLACRQADDVSRCEAVVDRDGAEAIGSTGQPVVSPYLLEARQGRIALARLLGQLAFPDEDEQPQTEASTRARKAADVRWAMRDRKQTRRGVSGAA